MPFDPQTTTALLRDADEPRRWLAFDSPLEVLQADSPGQVVTLLEEVERATRRGLTGVGFVSYEAAPAFDPSFVVRTEGATDCRVPAAWFALFRGSRAVTLDDWAKEIGRIGDEHAGPPPSWRPSLAAGEHATLVSQIHRHIALGHTYQVNLTFRLDAQVREDPATMFLALVRSQSAPYSAFLSTPSWAVCSVSPELFFRREPGRVMCRPMKGTAPRGRTTAEDAERAHWLRESEKNRAENLMIVDMVRNDLGRIARPGTVRVSELFEVERYHSVHQLTSSVEAESDATLGEIFTALFPCASVTGAPKVRTMELISALEDRPRGIYTGAVGWVAPGGSASFSVAIRTVWIDRLEECAVYGTGGGVVWDSSAEEEYGECRTKALVLLEPRPGFSLLETILWRPGHGYFLLRRHFDRLMDSADYFGIPLNKAEALRRLAGLATELPQILHRVRLLVNSSGGIRLAAEPCATSTTPWRVGLARRPIDRENRFLFHKTTWRAPYDRARAERPGFDDVILWNTAGEITESTVANVVVHRDGRRLTPARNSGLLAGTLREELLDRGHLEEALLTPRDLLRADRISLINSIRGWIEVDLRRDDFVLFERSSAGG